MAEWFAALAGEILGFLEAAQYPGLAIFLAAEGAGAPSPVPAELVTATIGLQIFRGRAEPWIAMPIAVSAATLGTVVLYWLARLIGRPLLDRYGRLVGIPDRRIRQLEEWFARHELWVVSVGRVIPAVRIIIPVVAGVARGDFRTFLVAVTLGNTLWVSLYVGLGWALGDTFESVASAVTQDARIGIGVAIGVVTLIVIGLAFRMRRLITRRLHLPGAMSRTQRAAK